MSRDLDQLRRVIDAMSGVRMLVVGDVVLDEYLAGEVDRVSPEAPVPVVHVTREDMVLGGAGNVARNIVALGGRCRFCSVVGRDDDSARVREGLSELGIDDAGLVECRARQTTRKTRVIARTQQIVRFDRETADPIDAQTRGRLLDAVKSASTDVDGAILEDYGKGVLVPDVARAAMEVLVAASVPVAVDPKAELAAYRGASLIKPNLREAEALTGVRVRGEGDLGKLAVRIRESVGDGQIVVTRGGQGMTIFDGAAAGVDVPTVSRSVFDVQGAGDTTIAALSLALRAGATLREAAIIANAAAGEVVGKVGTATVSRDELLAGLPAAIAAAEAGS